MKGLIVNVYRDSKNSDWLGDGDCTNGGESSRFDCFVLIGAGIPEIFEVTEDMPAITINTKQVGDNVFLNAKPLSIGSNMSMFGGNFIYTCDSRFPASYPIPVHDRVE